jgi:penicillin-binding protein 2
LEDSVSSNGSRLVTEAQQNFSFTRRAFVLGGAQIGLGALLAGRMAYISIAQNEQYTLKAESNRVNLTLLPPRRGWIVDRKGLPLALNRNVFRIDIVPDRLRDKEAVLATLETLIPLSPEDMADLRATLEDAAGYQPVQVAENVSWDAFAAVSIRLPTLPGVAPAQAWARAYPDGAAVGHLLGYVGSASAKDYEESKDPLLITPGFKVGKEGLERTFEPILRGKPGARRSEVTARGKLVRDLATRADVPGKPLRLTIDAGLQAYAARRMGDQSSALVCLDCDTGGILAMASMPCYDPNSFSEGISRLEWGMFSEDDHLPLINKSLQGLFPPGSTSKPMTSLALLGAGIDPEAKVNCTGAYRIGNSFFHCSQRRGHGPIALHEAIIKSCDIYFYHFARMAGIAPLAAMAHQMGLGQKFDLPFASQRFGTVPDPAWLKRRYKKDWSTFDTVNSSIGQGYMLVNPLQLAVMTARIASGRIIEPHLTGEPRHPATPLAVNPAHLAFVRDGMAGVVNSGRGTASIAKLPVPGVLMAGKTGTAQVRRITMAERAGGVRSNASLAWKQRDHSLFVAYAPVEAPRYAMGCIVEHGGFGASAAAPLVRDTMTYLFDPAKAMEILEAQERGWGGTIKERMDRKTKVYTAAHQPAPPPGTATNATATEPPNGTQADEPPKPSPDETKRTTESLPAEEALPEPPSETPAQPVAAAPANLAPGATPPR